MSLHKVCLCPSKACPNWTPNGKSSAKSSATETYFFCILFNAINLLIKNLILNYEAFFFQMPRKIQILQITNQKTLTKLDKWGK